MRRPAERLLLPLLAALEAARPASAGFPPVSDCHGLATAKLGPNVTILSAAIVTGAPPPLAARQAPSG